MPETEDYADKIAAKIIANRSPDYRLPRTAYELVAEGVREGYKIGLGVPR